ncbi:efflux RND transporter periplasmic adaptor subunit [Rhodoplanes roseus]|uniref:Efflux transporter periplasmic adaptor subunit n=1 Tax=Rhodoplanes roseus TaxID=29409 RepID=A0A327L0J9_9BRAD|nr:efflux transporter periplasmic adaptor subunit [Rhodoplanes roseus]
MGAAGVGATWTLASRGKHPAAAGVGVGAQALQRGGFYQPKDTEWASVAVSPVAEHAFRSQHITEGKIQIDEDHTTPIFSPYAGRVTRIVVRAGDPIVQGQTLFVVEANDMVQAQNDFVAALTGLNKASAALDFARIGDKRSRDLFDAKAVPLKDVQQAQAALTTAQNDMRSAETAIGVARDRLHRLGATEEAIVRLTANGPIDPEMPIYAPLSGTVVQRKIGPGQYVNAGASEPVVIVADLSTVRLNAFVRETEAGVIKVGQPLSFTVAAYPDRTFTGRVDYVASEIDGISRRLMVRATVDNADGLLKPEMLASVTIATNGTVMAAGVPREALIVEGNVAKVWVVRDDKGLELRRVETGMVDQRVVQIVDGLRPGERIVAGGSLLIDRIASGR